MRLRSTRSSAALAALGLTAAAAAVAFAPTGPAGSTTVTTGSTVLMASDARTAGTAARHDEPVDLGSHELEVSELQALAAERDLATDQAGDASALAETIKAARAGAVEQSTRTAEREALLSGEPREIGQLLAADRGFTGEQWSCLDSLWQRESNWNPSAQNRSSGAYGIPQSLPGSKMATVAPDWRTNPATQITWGLNYIVDRYGSPCGAWNHSESHNWY